MPLFKKNPDLPEGFTGLLPDTRTDKEKEKDYYIEETVASAVVPTFVKKDFADFRRFGMQNQDGSYSCVWQTMRKLLRVIFMVNRGLDLDFSATYGYRLRANYPGEGTMGIDALQQGGRGVTLNALMPSDNLSEKEMNAAKIEQYHKDVAENFKIPNYVQFKNGDFEKVCSTIEATRKGVMVWFYFTASEWGRQVPVIVEKNLNAQTALRHSVAAVDFGIYQGKRGIFIEDSAHFGGKHERFITEDFFRARNIFAAYPINFSFEHESPEMERPRYKLGDVKSLQNCLKYEGLFPVNVDSTGFYGPITIKAVKAFQERYGIEQTGQVGDKTAGKLKVLYP